MSSSCTHRGRSFIALSSLLGLALTLGSAILLSGCGESQVTTLDPKEDPAKIAKDSMDFYKNAHMKGGAAKKK